MNEHDEHRQLLVLAASDQAEAPSPCMSWCQIDATTGWCRGCYRTLDEIADWPELNDAGKRAVWAALPARFDSAAAR